MTEIQRRWIEEANRRLEEVRSGKVKTIPASVAWVKPAQGGLGQRPKSAGCVDAALSIAADYAKANPPYALPPIHADPFDRILIAQAITQAWTIVTADAVFARYSVSILPA